MTEQLSTPIREAQGKKLCYLLRETTLFDWIGREAFHMARSSIVLMYIYLNRCTALCTFALFQHPEITLRGFHLWLRLLELQSL